MIDLKIKNYFFDRRLVEDALDRAKRDCLSKAGAFVRTSARDSIRTRKGPSAPGEPPHSHVGTYRRFILFGYDPSVDSVVVGAAKLETKAQNIVPQTLEFGGDADIWLFKTEGHGFSNLGYFSKGRRVRRKQRIHIAPRPHMAPALAKNMDVIPRIWAGSVRSF